MDTTTKAQQDYENYLATLPRAERRRLEVATIKHAKWAKTSTLRQRDEERRLGKIMKQLEAKHATS